MNWEAPCIQLLKELIAIPSFSRKEDLAADAVESFFASHQIPSHRAKNNVWAKSSHWVEGQPTVLLNSHIDTVRPNADWTLEPFVPTVQDGKLYGLGSNDAGGCLVSLIAAFMTLQNEELPINLVIACTAEEEISGAHGIAYVQERLAPNFGIIGEPTENQMAIAEKGLMVVDGIAYGESGHAARDEGSNAIYAALADIQELLHHPFHEISPWLGPLKISVTQIEAGTQHNVVPDQCKFVVDIRTTELYPNELLLQKLQELIDSKLTARSTRLMPSFIELDHPLVQAGKACGLSTFGSPTLSDQALLKFPTIKMGPGDSKRSHTANEYIYLEEIKSGIDNYIAVLGSLKDYL